MSDDTRRKDPKVEGEGTYTATRDYDRAAAKTAKSGKVGAKAREARRAFEGREGDALRSAEAEGKRHAHGEDPALHRKPADVPDSPGTPHKK